MKKSHAIIPVVIILVLVLFLCVYMSLPIGQTSGNAVGGAVDLRGVDLGDSIYQLVGQWQYVPGKLVEPEDFPADAPVTVIPEKWPDSFEELNRCATYRLTIYTDDTRMLTMHIPEIITAYNMWVNGEFLRGAGVVADNAADGWPEFETVLIPVKAENGVLEIVIQASNYHYLRPIMNNYILLGERDAINSLFHRTRTLYVLALGAILAGVLYHVSLFFMRRKGITYLLYSILGMVCFWRFALETNGVSDYTGWFSANGLIDMKIYMTLFFLHGIAIALFSLYVFNRAWIFKHYRWVIGYALIGTALYLTIPWNLHYVRYIVIATMLPPIAVAIYEAARSKALREDKMLWLYFFALVLYAILSFVHKYYFDHSMFMTGLITDLFILLVQAIRLSRQYAGIREHEKLLEEKNELLDRLSQMKTELLQNTNHDLKAPLTVISTDVINAADMLDFDVGKEEIRECLDHAQNEIMRMARLIDGAMKHSAMQDNRHDMKPLDIAALLREGAESYRAVTERHGNTLNFDIPKSMPSVLGSADTLLHVLLNLLSNANRHMRNGEILVTADEVCGCIHVTVQDSGEGVRPEMLPHIFERGVSDGGTGLGLSICKNAIESHGGSIFAESVCGEGTTITFTIPAYEEDRG